MKRDMDLVRDLLLRIESAAEPPSSSGLSKEIGKAEGKTVEEQLSLAEAGTVAKHLRLMEEAGLLTCISSQPLSGPWRAQNIKMTWEGHDFLDTVRDPEVWKRTKEGASKMGGWTFDMLKNLGTAYLKHVAKERLGLDL